jgi:hypothetical protein
MPKVAISDTIKPLLEKIRRTNFKLPADMEQYAIKEAYANLTLQVNFRF